MPEVTGQVDFNSHLDAVISVAVSLVNTLTPGEARGRGYQPPAGGAACAAVTAALRTGQRSAHDVTVAEATDLAVQGCAAGCATGLAVVLGTDMYKRLGVCTASRCDRVYVDVSRNGTRRFCSTACQNRVKAAAFRARRA